MAPLTEALQTLVDAEKILSFELVDDSVLLAVKCRYNYGEECYDRATEDVSILVRHIMGQHGYSFRYDTLESLATAEKFTVECWVYAR